MEPAPAEAPGVGLGLAISRRITALRGGTLTAVSAIGQGSTFTVTLPVADALPAGPRQAPDSVAPRQGQGAPLADREDDAAVDDAALPISIIRDAGFGSTIAASAGGPQA